MNEVLQNQQNIFINKAMIDSVFNAQVANRWAVSQTTAEQRIEKLAAIETWINNNKHLIRKAIFDDFNKPAVEVDLTEIYPAISEIRYTKKHLKKWLKPHRVKRTLALVSTRSWLQCEPRGNVLIIAPWNYPFGLNISPLVLAVAAGNCAILKPSELAKHTSKLLSQMIAGLFPKNEVAVFEGEKEVAIDLLRYPFDHIFFTGSTSVGKMVMAAASNNLSSITLELGGKSPTIVDASVNLKDAAEKIIWSKFINCGQTCIAPDYVFVHHSVSSQFIEKLKSTIQKFYRDTDLKDSNLADYSHIIDQKHFNRLKKVMDDSVRAGALIDFGGETFEDIKMIKPTILSNVKTETPIMEEEIFGPILPIIEYNDLDDVIEHIRERPKPLALYIFSKEKTNIDKILLKTSSGGVCINDAVIYYSQIYLPFGGVNASGMGRTHGFHGFKTFSNEKAVLKQGKFSPLKLIYPPYTKRVKKIIDLMLKYL